MISERDIYVYSEIILFFIKIFLLIEIFLHYLSVYTRRFIFIVVFVYLNVIEEQNDPRNIMTFERKRLDVTNGAR